MVPVLRDVLEPVCAPPILTTTPAADEVVDPVDVDGAVDPDPVDVKGAVDRDRVDVPVLVEEPAEVFAEPELEPLVGEPDEFEADPDDVEDDPPESGVAHATP